MHIHPHPSPNHRPRREGEHLRYIILHGTYMADDAAALARLSDPATEVSCHYLITHTGELFQLVDESLVAFHAGQSTWDGISGLNGYSLGIELGNAGPFTSPPTPQQEANPDFTHAPPYTEAQYTTLIALLKDIMTRHPHIQPHHVLGHNEVSPGRKSDPGPHFNWSRLAAAGLALPRPLKR
ncbi:MAG: N-acetylmuramoyl-L-alanine amidase [Pseudomonadaceae bacterium]|nr:N-acetylmuramoyl-L-alanine amidase [Pseudomonadaceae bacterium]